MSYNNVSRTELPHGMWMWTLMTERSNKNTIFGYAAAQIDSFWNNLNQDLNHNFLKGTHLKAVALHSGMGANTC